MAITVKMASGDDIDLDVSIEEFQTYLNRFERDSYLKIFQLGSYFINVQQICYYYERESNYGDK